jgi:hypothetical protein
MVYDSENPFIPVLPAPLNAPPPTVLYKLITPEVSTSNIPELEALLSNVTSTTDMLLGGINLVGIPVPKVITAALFAVPKKLGIVIVTSLPTRTTLHE